MGSIKVVGMGPGDFGNMTVEVWETIQKAGQLILRTAIHPTTKEMERRGISFLSYDEQYETAENFETLYSFIADDLISLAKAGAGE